MPSKTYLVLKQNCVNSILIDCLYLVVDVSSTNVDYGTNSFVSNIKNFLKNTQTLKNNRDSDILFGKRWIVDSYSLVNLEDTETLYNKLVQGFDKDLISRFDIKGIRLFTAETPGNKNDTVLPKFIESTL